MTEDCYVCGNDFEKGALLFSPPEVRTAGEYSVFKIHICTDCFRFFKLLMMELSRRFPAKHGTGSDPT